MLHHWPYFILKRRWDLQQLKEMGFNMVRKHIKIEVGGWQHFFHLLPPDGQVELFHFHQVDRWYYWADRLGLLVWQVGKCWSKIPFNFNSEAGRHVRKFWSDILWSKTLSIQNESEPSKNVFFQDFPAISDQQTERLQDDWRAQVLKSHIWMNNWRNIF